MSAVKTEDKVEYRCTCGRTFAHEISLKRHCWVTGHSAEEATAAPSAAAPVTAAPAPVAVEAPVAVVAPIELPSIASVDAVDEALRILREKQAAQQAFEARQARERQVRELVHCASKVVESGVQKATEASRQGAAVMTQSALLAVRMLVMILICGGLLLTGMGVGRLLATPAQASTELAPAAQRQLIGHQLQP